MASEPAQLTHNRLAMTFEQTANLSARAAQLLLALPFVIASIIPAANIEPAFEWLIALGLPSTGGFGIVGFYFTSLALVLWPIGAIVTWYPLLKERRWRTWNAAVGAMLLVGLVYLFVKIGNTSSS